MPTPKRTDIRLTKVLTVHDLIEHLLKFAMEHGADRYIQIEGCDCFGFATGFEVYEGSGYHIPLNAEDKADWVSLDLGPVAYITRNDREAEEWETRAALRERSELNSGKTP